MSTINSGIVLRLLPKTAYDFSKITAGVGNSQIITLAQHIDVAPFTEAVFIVRAHTLSLAGAATITFSVVIDGYEFGDPGVTGFLQPNNPAGAPLGQVQMTSGTVFPFFQNLAVPTNFGRFVAIQLTGAVPMGAVGGTCAISVDLSLKGGDATMRAFVPNTFQGYRLEQSPLGRSIANCNLRAIPVTDEYPKVLVEAYRNTLATIGPSGPNKRRYR
jgi:hypothetical protein